MLCRACSEGSPGHGHGHHPADGGWSTERDVGIAGEPDAARAVLDSWAAAGAGRSWADLEVALR